MKLGNLAALNRYGADPIDPVEGRFQVVGGYLPQTGLRNRILSPVVRRERVTENGKGSEGETVGGDAGGCGQRPRDPG